MKVIWYMVPEIWSSTDRIFLSFWTIFCSFTSLTTQKIKILKKWKKHLEILSLYICTINDNHLMHGSWDMECDGHSFFCNFRLFFALLPPNNLKNQNFEKLKKTSGNIAILNKCTKNHYHMLYCSLDIACNGCNCYFSFWGIFCPFTPLTARKKNKMKKKWKKRLEISFQTSVPKIMITYAILFLRYGVWQM